MDFEKHLEKLGHRVDALTESVGLIASLYRDTEKLHRENETRMAQMMDAITRLAHIADIHDQRIEDLENRA